MCPHCGKVCVSERGLTQHISRTPDCNQKHTDSMAFKRNQSEEDAKAGDSTDTDQSPNEDQPRRSQRVAKKSKSSNHNEEPGVSNDGLQGTDSHVGDDAESREAPSNSDADSIPFADPTDDAFYDEDDTESGASGDQTEAPTDEEMDDTSVEEGAQEPNRTMLKEFRDYCEGHYDQFLWLKEGDKTSIRLMNCLKLKKAPLNAYKELMEWHLKETGELASHETLKDTNKYQGRETLIGNLSFRYNVSSIFPKIKRVKLPHSKAVVPVVYTDVADCIVSLLTDPRFEDSDYLFHGDNPLAPPPDSIDYVADLNTGDAYLSTYEDLVTEANQAILPTPLYIDGAVTGQFSELPITALKITLGIFKREVRDREHAWRIVGYVPQVRKQQGRGKQIFKESKHLESHDVQVMAGEGDEAELDSEESDEEDDGMTVKAQDFHTILSAILESYVKLQGTGFIWDLVYKGKMYKGIHFLPFVPFVKCDTEEGDMLAGKYQTRTKNVKHLCRYCHCPTQEADDPRAKYPPKTQPAIQKLIEKGNLAKLKAMSQQYIKNAWYDIQFHTANEAGIHGACPSEMLHAILLGIFKYLRDIFFDRMGKTSVLADDINALATMYGKLLTRQSDRSLPNTNFTKGIRKGKLMAKMYRGVLLIMAAVLRSEKGSELLMKRKKFGKESGLHDWCLLTELLLEWEAFLNQKRMLRKHVIRLRKKHRFIMYVMKSIANRDAGMGLKLMKFHAILHLVEDILLYGVPTEFDTGSNESHHKSSKHAAKLTQRKESTFNEQTAKRLCEFHVIDLAMEEVGNGKKVWEYFDGVEDWDPEANDEGNAVAERDPHDTNPGPDDGEAGGNAESSEAEDVVKTTTGGTKIRVYEDPDDDGTPTFQLQSRSQHTDNTTWMTEVVVFLNNLQNKVRQHLPNLDLKIRTEHKRDDIVFRGHPNYRGLGPWKDWALVDWGRGYGKLPCHIWCFVDLTTVEINNQHGIEHGGITVQNHVYAVVESAQYDKNKEERIKSDFFQPLLLDVGSMDADGEVATRQFYLADTDAFVGPCVVIPNIGGPTNSYFKTLPRSEWADQFILWLERPHTEDETRYSDEESSEEE